MKSKDLTPLIMWYILFAGVIIIAVIRLNRIFEVLHDYPAYLDILFISLYLFWMVIELRVTKKDVNTEGKKDVFKTAKLTADAGFHNEANMKMVAEQDIDAYIADTRFRQRDPRFNDVEKNKARSRKERSQKSGTNKKFTTDDFKFAGDLSYCICPAGKRFYRNGSDTYSKGLHAVRFMGLKCACVPCKLKKKCLRHPERTLTRAVAYFTGKKRSRQKTYTQQMKEKIDTELGRANYSKRIGTVVPVFAHLRYALRLDRFTVRGYSKVNIQWKLYSIVHNLLKVHRFGFQCDTG